MTREIEFINKNNSILQYEHTNSYLTDDLEISDQHDKDIIHAANVLYSILSDDLTDNDCIEIENRFKLLIKNKRSNKNIVAVKKESFFVKKGSTLKGGKTCSYCFAKKTPLWRHGPVEFPDLCNRCGVKYMRGKLF